MLKLPPTPQVILSTGSSRASLKLVWLAASVAPTLADLTDREGSWLLNAVFRLRS